MHGSSVQCLTIDAKQFTWYWTNNKRWVARNLFNNIQWSILIIWSTFRAATFPSHCFARSHKSVDRSLFGRLAWPVSMCVAVAYVDWCVCYRLLLENNQNYRVRVCVCVCKGPECLLLGLLLIDKFSLFFVDKNDALCLRKRLLYDASDR